MTLTESPIAVRAEIPSPSAPLSNRPLLTPDERAQIDEATARALRDAESDRGIDNCGPRLNPSEVAEWVHDAEHEALARIYAARDSAIAGEHRPTAEDAPTVSPGDQANALGYSLVMAGEDPTPPRDMPFHQLVAF